MHVLDLKLLNLCRQKKNYRNLMRISTLFTVLLPLPGRSFTVTLLPGAGVVPLLCRLGGGARRGGAVMILVEIAYYGSKKLPEKKRQLAVFNGNAWDNSGIRPKRNSPAND